MNKFYTYLLVIFILLAGCEEGIKFIPIEISGTFVYKGSGTFPTLFFKEKDGKLYYIVTPESTKLAKYQGKEVRIKALTCSVVLESADHKYKQKRNILKNIVVTSSR